jgi:hypothetical protein
VFDNGNGFSETVYETCNTEAKRYGKSESLIREFRTNSQQRVAVTVNVIDNPSFKDSDRHRAL